MNETTPPLPSVHRNGTSQQELLDQQRKVRTALRAAMAVMAESAPNGRDYYVQSNDAYGVARAAHEDRMRRICEVYAEIGSLVDGISKGGHGVT